MFKFAENEGLIDPKRKRRRKVVKFLFACLSILLGIVVGWGIGEIRHERSEISNKKKLLLKDEKDVLGEIAIREKIISVWIKKINRNVPIEMVSIISHEICEQTSEAKLPIPLILAIMQRESHFDPLAVSKSKACGLMQVLNGGKGISIDKDKVFDITYNIAKGIEILKEHLRLKNGNLDNALFGYVGGDRSYASDIYKIIGEFSLFEASYKRDMVEEMK